MVTRILLVEDNATDALLLEEVFYEIPHFEHLLFRAERLTEALICVSEQSFDVVLLDLGLPDSHGLATFLSFRAHAPNLPVLVLTALDDMAIGLHTMQDGAQDYLIKSQIQASVLVRAIRYAIERNHLRIALQHSRDGLRRLAVRLQALRESERARLSREVHDEFGQKLTALKMDLAWLRTRLDRPLGPASAAAMKERLQETEQLTDRTIDAVQRIAVELRPSALDHLGLLEAIRDESRRFEARSGISVLLTLVEGEKPRNADTSTACFRVFQELLTNVARHAKASEVAVRLVDDGQSLVLDLKDNGVGMSADTIHSATSLGLLGMRERLAVHQGEILFESAPGEGTRAIVKIPIRAKASSQHA